MTTVTHKEATIVTRTPTPNLGGLQNDKSEARNPNPTAIAPKEGTEPGEDTVPHPGGAFAKVGGGAFAGGCIPNVLDNTLPPEEEPASRKR